MVIANRSRATELLSRLESPLCAHQEFPKRCVAHAIQTIIARLIFPFEEGNKATNGSAL